jgi:hypothetical protein
MATDSPSERAPRTAGSDGECETGLQKKPPEKGGKPGAGKKCFSIYLIILILLVRRDVNVFFRTDYMPLLGRFSKG